MTKLPLRPALATPNIYVILRYFKPTLLSPIAQSAVVNRVIFGVSFIIIFALNAMILGPKFNMCPPGTVLGSVGLALAATILSTWLIFGCNTTLTVLWMAVLAWRFGMFQFMNPLSSGVLMNSVFIYGVVAAFVFGVVVAAYYQRRSNT